MGKFMNFLGGVAESVVKGVTGSELDLNKDGKVGAQVGTGYYKSWEKGDDGKFQKPATPKPTNPKAPPTPGGGKDGAKSGEDQDDMIFGLPKMVVYIGGALLAASSLGLISLKAKKAAPRRRRRRRR